MSAIPATIRTFVTEQDGTAVTRGVRPFAKADLFPGEVEVRVLCSVVNNEDSLATIVGGKVARISPLIPGVDLAGGVVASSDPAIPPGAAVSAHGYDLGVSRHGGFAEYARVPAGWVVSPPPTLTSRLAISLGTAGLVTGASGGLGAAVGILAALAYEGAAATGNSDEADRLRGLGDAAVINRAEVTAGSARPLESERWAGVVDCVGGATLPYILRTLRRDATVAASGSAGGPAFATTVFPFILRAVALVGIDSSQVPIGERRALWQRLGDDLRPNGLNDGATEVTLETLSDALDGILAGRARGRWIVRIGG